MNPSQPQRLPHGEQRVLSAKMHRLKALQNQLADAHFHLQELSNENRTLRALQKKQEIALQRYESSSAELPQVLSAHGEEMRVQHAKYQQVRRRLRDLEGQLRDRDLRLQTLQDQHRHLLDLTRDKNLPEREKLQAQVTELQETVRQQRDTIAALQRRLTLEAKNFRHRLQAEIEKHRDTRHDLDLAITNADKLSTIIEMKEKMISTAASRGGGSRSPPKAGSVMQFARPLTKNTKFNEDRSDEQGVLSRLCENSRSLSSSLSREERPPLPRSQRAASAARFDLTEAVQEGMAGLVIAEEPALADVFEESSGKKIEAMKADLMNKIKNTEEAPSFKIRPIGRQSIEETELILEVEPERPDLRRRRSSAVSFKEAGRFTETDHDRAPANENRETERKPSGRRVERYCKDILEDIEKSSRVIDGHVLRLSAAAGTGERIAEQLRAVDRVNELVNASGELPAAALSRLQEEFSVLTQHAMPPRLRAAADDPLGDRTLSNRDLLEDLLGKK